jgi:hypothetical protein
MEQIFHELYSYILYQHHLKNSNFYCFYSVLDGFGLAGWGFC